LEYRHFFLPDGNTDEARRVAYEEKMKKRMVL
jgi:hypothetical protein